MTLEEKQVLMALCERQTDSLLQSESLGNDTPDFGDDFGVFDNILSGTHPLEISHASGEFQELARHVLNAMHTKYISPLTFCYQPFISHQSCRDYWSHRDCAQLCAIAFKSQIQAVAKAYLTWSFNCSQQGHRGFFKESSGVYTGSTDSCTGQVMLNVIDLFWTDQFNFLIPSTDSYILPVVVQQGAVPCSPVKPMHAFSIDMLELFQVACNCNLHFSIQSFIKMLCDLQGVAFQPYISHQFTIVLNQYLQILQYVWHMMLTMICHTGPLWHLKNAYPACTYTLQVEPELNFSLLYMMDGNDSLKHAIKCEELLLGQVLACDQYLTQEEVDVFAKYHWVDIDMLTEGNEDNPCAGCWKNMKDQHTARMWSVFDETGIFMVYPLAVVSRLLDAFGKGLGGGYDIRCKFKTTLSRSSLSEHAWLLAHTPLVRSFHRHAHSCLCQLDHLMTYVEELGLEDLEGSMFLHNNYKQALTILRETQECLLQLKHELSITDNLVFHAWLAEEQAYLLQMTYWQRLVNLTASRHDVISTMRLETAWCHAQENYDKDLAAVQESKLKLEITSHWKPGDTEWQNGGSLVAQHKYQHALNNLESLVMAHIFELRNMNQAGTTLSPLHHTLTLEEVVEYTFLSDFQLLQDTCKDISQCPWASPTACLVLDTYFKISHIKCLVEITTLPGFSGTLEPGKSMNVDAGAPAGPITIVPSSFITTYPSLEVPLEEDTPNDLDEEQEEEEALVECTCTLKDVLSITV
ncbi:hypothetical protein V8B97DRAFT_2025519 [Scleroderma yunnanense]